MAREAASGVTQLGRNGIRDKWAGAFIKALDEGDPDELRLEPMSSMCELPLPSELELFRRFLLEEKADGRGVMTGEHQVSGQVFTAFGIKNNLKVIIKRFKFERLMDAAES